MNYIILEGPDGSGKTELASRLSQTYGYRLEHCGVPDKSVLKNEETIFNHYLKLATLAVDSGHKTVFDRLHLGERIYGEVMRGGSPMTIRGEVILERYLESVDAQIVICLPPYRVALNNWIARQGSEYVANVKDFRRIYEKYTHLLFNHERNRNFVWYDYTRHRGNSVAQALVHLCGVPIWPAVGSQRPRFLIIDPKMELTTTGHNGFLYEVLKAAGFQEHEMAFIKSGSADFWKALKNMTRITFGELMDDAYYFPHPEDAMTADIKGIKIYIDSLAKLRRNSP